MTPVASIGAVLNWNGAAVAKLTKVDGIEAALAMINVTTHDSTGGYDEVIPGRFSTSPISIEGYFDAGDSAGQIAMVADFNAKTLRAGTLSFPAVTGTVWSFNGYITKISIKDAGIDGVIPFTSEITITGKPSLATTYATGLSALVCSNSGVIAPAVAVGTYDYVITVLTGVSSVTLTPTAAGQTITVNGTAVASGAASGAIALGAAGSITTATIVVSETNKASRTYTARIVRAAA